MSKADRRGFSLKSVRTMLDGAPSILDTPSP